MLRVAGIVGAYCPGRVYDFTPEDMMKRSTTTRAEAEPVGIVIAGPSRTEVVPRVLAYVWGPAPEPAVEVEEELLPQPRAA